MAQLCAGICVLLLALHVQGNDASQSTGPGRGARSQMVQMDSSKSGFVGSQVELRCIFINSNPPVKISQVTWQKLLNGTKQNVAIANPALGVSVLPPFKERVSFKQAAVRHRTPSLEDTTIVFSNLQLYDEAAYICEYTTFPAGNRENMVNLTVFARPMTRMTLTTPTIVARSQRRKMTVATCVSANGKPPSIIRWDTRLKGEATFQETRNQNGTVTVRSNYVIVPGRETHKQKLTCIVTYRNERFTDSVVLNVQYEPEVKIEGFDANWYLNRQNVQLTCRADANPPVTIYQWKLLNGSLPSNVEIKNNSLFFKGPVTYDLAGTYVCDATNGIGTRTGIVDVNITEKPMARGPPGGVIGILGGIVAIGLIIGVAVTVVMVHRRQQKTRTETDNDLIAVAAVTDSCVTQAAEKPESATRTDLPPAHKPAPPPPKKKNSDMKGHLTSDDIQVVHLDKDEEIQKLPLQPPYYDMAPSESTPFTDKLNSGHKDCEVQYAELDTAALASSPSPRSSAHSGPGDLVEYATIQPSSH
ncbi:nectin-1-like isoform X4 [Corythoichthys intestinalis]|uniref:nectin-1-like isoform X4 n=1 Tax=Corythoichthys intestinalis TaxID=161448 RepID=UPI0025A5302D|nr:nectin-1-like isoform X4 [Corythoichthys intestinalis]XP_057694668.1 nectin-1-like isoform X4 [Corythoichthys intestinalis]